MNWEVFVLREETKLQTRIEVVRSTTGFILFGLGCLISLPVAAAAKIVESSVSYMLYRRHMDRLIGAGPGELLNVYRRSAALTAAATVPAFGLMCVTGFSPDTSIAAMVVAVALGIAAWATLLVRTNHPLVDELRRARELIGSRIVGRARA